MKSKYKIIFFLKTNFLIFITSLLYFCAPIEVSDKVVFDNNLLNKISINAAIRNINNVYEVNYLDPYVDTELSVTPLTRLNNWIKSNIIVFGSRNKLDINVIEASITKTERDIDNKKKFEEKKEFYYEINFIIEYIIYNNDNLILATSKVKTKRSKTSSIFTSLDEKEKIMETLILDALIDISKKSDEVLKIHMTDYII